MSTLAWGPGLDDQTVLNQGVLVRSRLGPGIWLVEADAPHRERLRALGAWITWPIPNAAARMPGCSGDLPRLDQIHRTP